MLLNKQTRWVCGDLAGDGKNNLWILKGAKAEAVTRDEGGTTFTSPSLCDEYNCQWVHGFHIAVLKENVDATLLATS